MRVEDNMTTDPLALVNLVRLRTLLRDTMKEADRRLEWCEQRQGEGDGTTCAGCSHGYLATSVGLTMLDALETILGKGGEAGEIAALALAHASPFPEPATGRKHCCASCLPICTAVCASCSLAWRHKSSSSSAGGLHGWAAS